MIRSRQLLPLALASALAASSLVACSEDAEPETSPSPSATSSPASPTSPTATPSPGPPQRAELVMHAQLAQPGPGPAAAADALSAMTATFRPVRPGREVELHVREGDDWTTTDTAAQDKDGVVEFTAPYQVDGGVQTYRVAATADGNLPQEVSPPVRTDAVGAADFSEEFNGTDLEVDWSDRLQGYLESRTCSMADPRASSVAGGTLRLSAMLDPGRRGARCRTQDGAFDYLLSGHVSTEGQAAFKYGTFAARIKFQQARGQHGAFWLQPASRVTEVGDPANTGAEIDVVEWRGNDHSQGGLNSYIYYYPRAGAKQVGDFVESPEQYGEDWAEAYHVFSVEWTPKEYVFRIDGQETMRISEGVSGQPQFMILSLLTSDYELPLLGSTDRLPQHMYVDWVRHWPR